MNSDIQKAIDEILSKTEPTLDDMTKLGWLNELKLGESQTETRIVVVVSKFGFSLLIQNPVFGTEFQISGARTQESISNAMATIQKHFKP